MSTILTKISVVKLDAFEVHMYISFACKMLTRSIVGANQIIFTSNMHPPVFWVQMYFFVCLMHPYEFWLQIELFLHVKCKMHPCAFWVQMYNIYSWFHIDLHANSTLVYGCKQHLTTSTVTILYTKVQSEYRSKLICIRNPPQCI